LASRFTFDKEPLLPSAGETTCIRAWLGNAHSLFVTLQSRDRRERTWQTLFSAAFLFLLASAALASDPDAVWRQAQSELKAGRYEAAESLYKEFVKLQPDVGEGWANLGLALHMQKKRDTAIEAFQRALKLKPGLLHAQLFLGINLFNANRTAQAKPLLAAYTAAAPRDPQGHYYLGLTFTASGAIEDAMYSFEKAAELAPKDVDILYHLAQNYITQANELTRRAAESDPKIPIIKRWQEEHDSSTARDINTHAEREKLKTLRPRLGRTPPDLDAEQEGAVALANLHLATTSRFYALEPEGFRIHQLRAGYYEQTSRRELAIKELNTALSINPNVRGVHLALGAIYKDSSQPELALKELKAELALASPDPAAHLQLAQVYLMLQQAGKALAELKLYKQTAPRDPLLYRTLGKTYVSLGELAQAQASYEKAIEHGDRDRGTYYQLGQVYRKLGKTELAAKAFAATNRALQDELARDRARVDKARRFENRVDSK